MEGLIGDRTPTLTGATARWCRSSAAGGESEKAGHSRRFKEGAGSHNVTLKMSKFPSKITLKIQEPGRSHTIIKRRQR